MRVLMVMAKMLSGGAEIAALELVRALSADGVSFVMTPVRSGDDGLGEKFRQAGAEVTAPIAKCKFDPLAPLRLRKIMRTSEASVTLMVGALRNAMFYMAAGTMLGRYRIPRLCWCHSRPGGQARRFAGLLRLCINADVINAVVCVSKYQRGLLLARGLPMGRLAVIPNGINLDALDNAEPTKLTLPAGKRIIVQVANVMPDKDHAALIEAAALLRARRDDFHLLLVGRGTDSSAMVQQVHRAGIDDCCTLAGLRDDVAGILAAADVFVLSSRGEVMPLALLEAMAASLPVVVSDIPAMDEMVTSRHNGLKFSPGCAAELADRLDGLLSDEARMRQMGYAAREWVGVFSRREMARRFGRLLRTVSRGASEAG